MDTAPKPGGEPEVVAAKTELPAVESPPLSPASEAASEPVIAANESFSPAVEPSAGEASGTAGVAAGLLSPFSIRPRHKRYAVLAISVTFAAALGAVIGALASSGSPPPAKADVATIDTNKAMQHSIAQMNKEIAALKANLDQATKTAHTQIAKISDRLEHQAADITGSIAAPQTVPVEQGATAVPLPRPAQRTAAADPASGHVPVVRDWFIHDFRNGYVFVQGHGEIFQVQIGAPLPGLGPVQSVRRQDGHWMVLTPKGMIVSVRDRRYFEDD